MQALLAVEFCYTGRLEGLTESEVSHLLEATAHLGIIGLSWSPATVLIKQETPTAELEDDVFAEVEVEEDQFRLGVGTGLEEEEEKAMDLSPVSRHPPAAAAAYLRGSLLPAMRRISALSKISAALGRAGGGGGEGVVRLRGGAADCGPPRTSCLSRPRKPGPLPLPPPSPPPAAPALLKPPRTPLLASPDCQLLEEKFKNLIENNPTDPEKLRNLSVSSADFNFEGGGGGGGSLPNTPLRSTTARSFNFPPSAPAPQPDTLDLSIKKVCSESEGEGDLPTIEVHSDVWCLVYNS